MLITEQSDLEAFCASLENQKFITVDTEFLREKTYYPKLCLIQISDEEKNAAAVDVLAEGLDLEPVFALLRDEAILKIFHAGRQDLEIFYQLMEEIPQPIFDTQIAAMVCGYGEQVGYENLIRQTTGHQVDKSSQFTNWSYRPLSEKQITYAIGDVTHLVDAYLHLSKELEKRGRTAWVFEEEEIMNDPATYVIKPEEAWKRVKMRKVKPKTLAIVQKLAAWREGRAQAKDLPKSWVMKDDTLMDLANQAPHDEKGLKKIRGLANAYTNGGHAKDLLGMIRDVSRIKPADLPEQEKKKGLSPSQAAVADVLKLLLKIQAAEHDVAAKLIASKDDVEALAVGDGEGTAVMKGWRYEVFGKDAVALKAGELTLGLDGCTIVKKTQ